MRVSCNAHVCATWTMDALLYLQKHYCACIGSGRPKTGWLAELLRVTKAIAHNPTGGASLEQTIGVAMDGAC